jgi:hypothetical protein
LRNDVKDALGDRLIAAIERREALLQCMLREGPRVRVFDGGSLGVPDRVDWTKLRSLHAQHEEARAKVEELTAAYHELV